MYKLITHSIVEEHFEEKPNSYGPQKKKEIENEEDVVKLNVPLLIRLMEYSREDASGDLDLHVAAEKMIELSEEGKVLTMEHYSSIIPCSSEEVKHVKSGK